MSVSVMCVRGIVEELRRAGVAPNSLLLAVGLDEPRLADMRTMLPRAQFESLVSTAMQLTQNPALGLTVGARAPENMFQLVACFASVVPTMRDAFDVLARYAPLFVDDVSMSLSAQQGLATFRFDFRAGLEPDAARFAAECFASMVTRVASQQFAAGARPHELRFRHPAPAYSEQYVTVFGCPVHFETGEQAIVFDEAHLDRRQLHTDSAMADMLRQAAEHLLTNNHRRVAMADRIRGLLRKQPDLCNLDATAIAGELGVSLRALRRSLARDGLTMTTLADEARVDAARVELSRPGVTIKDTAQRLGYSELSAFHRAFKRWTGKTPAEYVRESKQRLPGHLPRAAQGEPLPWPNSEQPPTRLVREPARP